MTSRILFAALSLMLTVSSASAATADGRFKPSEARHKAMLRELDQVFGWAGVRRLSDLQHLSCSDSNDYAVCTAKISLSVDGKPDPYNVEFAGQRRRLGFASFYPDEPTPDPEHAGFSNFDRDDVKDPRLRAFAIAAIEKFNRHLGWHWVSRRPAIQRDGKNLFVTYRTMSDTQMKDPLAVLMSGQPSHVSFYVSPRGNICGAIYSE
jgi:hypothetical protein